MDVRSIITLVNMKLLVAELCMKWLLLIGSCQVSATEDILKYDHKHRTHKAVEKANGLWCHRCHTMDINKEYCMNVSKNETSLHHKCEGDQRICMVKRVSYSTTSSNSSAIVHKVWSLERNCTQKCEPGCIIIGERTKIRICSTCCETSFCNSGRGRGEKWTLAYGLFLFCCFIVPTWKMALWEVVNFYS